MFRLIRFLISLLLLVAFGYVAIFVQFGDKTLWNHFKAIVSSDESKDLVDGVKQKANDLLKREAATPANAARRVDGGEPVPPPADDYTQSDKEGLKKLIREKRAKR